MASYNDIETAAVFAEEDFVVEAQTFLHALMEEKGVTRAELARAMGVSRARVTQIFSDECKNFTVRLLARATHALSEVPKLTRVQRDEIDCNLQLRMVHPEDMDAIWDISGDFSTMKQWVACNDQGPKKLTRYEFSELEWEAA